MAGRAKVQHEEGDGKGNHHLRPHRTLFPAPSLACARADCRLPTEEEGHDGGRRRARNGVESLRRAGGGSVRSACDARNKKGSASARKKTRTQRGSADRTFVLSRSLCFLPKQRGR